MRVSGEKPPNVYPLAVISGVHAWERADALDGICRAFRRG